VDTRRGPRENIKKDIGIRVFRENADLGKSGAFNPINLPKQQVLKVVAPFFPCFKG
jgi:hypothetical protein